MELLHRCAWREWVRCPGPGKAMHMPRGCTSDLLSVPQHCVPSLPGQASVKHQVPLAAKRSLEQGLCSAGAGWGIRRADADPKAAPQPGGSSSMRRMQRALVPQSMSLHPLLAQQCQQGSCYFSHFLDPLPILAFLVSSSSSLKHHPHP